MFSWTTQLTLMELRTTSKLPWQIYFRLATGDIYIFEELSVKYQENIRGSTTPHAYIYVHERAKKNVEGIVDKFCLLSVLSML